MSLLENVVAALLFSGVASISLGIWSLGLSAEAQRAARQRDGDRIEAELTALDLRLRSGAALLAPSTDCAGASQRLAALVSAQPPAAGLRRQLSIAAPAPLAEPGLWVTVALAEASPGSADQGRGPEERRRWFSPAALGVCGGWGGAADATR